ncbi:MAG: 1-acyl-sn-glycerol-3-phosphate acyltransferase [Bacteroidia bacterium]
MIYQLIKLLLKGTIRVFFRSITISNADFVPKKGPLVLLANHPSTFMDPIVLASVINRKVYFLGKGEMFKGAFAKWFLSNMNIIPVYRKQDDPTELNKNADTFRKCYEHLENDGVILIFPEGVSVTERKLKPIKGGASHIALGTEGRNDFKLGVKIINIGLNYADQHKFNKDLYINIHEPIEIANYAEKFKADKTKTIKELTETITQQLEEVVISINDAKTDELVKDIETLYMQQLKEKRGVDQNDLEAEFSITKNIVKAVNYYLKNEPQFVETMQLRIKIYLNNLSKLQLNNSTIEQNKSTVFVENAKSFLLLILGFPLYLFGLINNFLPFEIPGFVAVRLVKSKDYKGAIGMVLGMFTFIVFYSLQISFFKHFSQNNLLTLIYALSLPVTGFFAYYYWHKFTDYRSNLFFNNLFKNKRTLIDHLISERNSIIYEFEQAKEDFLAKNK